MNGVPAGASSCPAVLVDDAGPPRRRRRPDDRRLAVDLGVRPALRDQRRRQPRRHAARPHEHAATVDLGVVGVVELVGELGEQGDLLAADGHVDDDAVAGIGLADRRRLGRGRVVGIGRVVVAARSRPPSARAAATTSAATPRAVGHVASCHSVRRASIVEALGSGCVAADGVVPAGARARPRRRRRGRRGPRPRRAPPAPPPTTWTAQGSWRRIDRPWHPAPHARRRWWRRRRGRRPAWPSWPAACRPTGRTGSTAPASRRSHGMNAGSASQRRPRDRRRAEVAGDGGGERAERRGLALDDAERRAHRAPLRLAAEVGPRRARRGRRCSATAARRRSRSPARRPGRPPGWRRRAASRR